MSAQSGLGNQLEGIDVGLDSTVTHESGWFPDPYNRSEMRYWDGNTWTAHAVNSHGQQIIDEPTYRINPEVQISDRAVVVQNTITQSTPSVVLLTTKSKGTAFALTLFFGPLGMFYSTVAGALIMIAISFVLVPLTLGMAVLILWPISILWGVLAAGQRNSLSVVSG